MNSDNVNSPQRTLLLEEITLSNFRCFADCPIRLHENITVFVADNGQGKTSILEAISLALNPFVDAILDGKKNPGFTLADIRRERNATGKMDRCPPVKISARAYVNHNVIEWSRERGGITQRSRTSDINTKTLTAAASNIVAATGLSTNSLWPIIVHYDARRAAVVADGSNVGVPIKEQADRNTGYRDHLNPISSFSQFIKWYRGHMLNLRERPSAGVSRKNRPELLLAAVNQAARIVLEPTGWCNLHWDYDEDTLMVEHVEKGRFPLGTMSDGVRNMLAVVADMAHRCCRLNPHLEDKAALGTPGVVLIDEVDLHLHPGWQQLVVGLLRDAFPLVQFVFTTHSPQVLSTVDADCIRVVKSGPNNTTIIEEPLFQTRGVESADVLAAIMDVDPVPKLKESQQLQRYRGLIEQGNGQSDEASLLRIELVDHFGDQHPVMLECERLLRFFEFKKKRENNKQ